MRTIFRLPTPMSLFFQVKLKLKWVLLSQFSGNVRIFHIFFHKTIFVRTFFFFKFLCVGRIQKMQLNALNLSCSLLGP